MSRVLVTTSLGQSELDAERRYLLDVRAALI